MRKRFGTGVIVAALVFGLAAPGFSGTNRGDQVVAAGLGGSAAEAAGALGRGFRAVLRWFGHNGAETEAAMGRLRDLVRMRLGRTNVSERLQWKLVAVACTAKDVDEFVREDEVYERMWMLAEELPDFFGTAASVYNLANDLAKAEDDDERARIQATARFCAQASLEAGW